MFRRKSQRQPKQQDPFSRINAWDDGYEYIRDKPPSPPAGYPPAPFYSPPMSSRAEPRRHAADYHFPKRSYPSPPSSSDRRHRRRSPSPPPYRATRSPSPRRRDVPLGRSKSMRDPPRGRDYSPPPRREYSPQPRRRPARSPSPVLPGGRLHNRSRRAYSPSPSRSPSPTRHRKARSRSPPPRQKSTKEARPNLARSKTTPAKERFSGLSPRWQAAAAAALQAGSMAALNARSQPGAWAGEKGARVATAALGAAAMNAFQKEQDKERGGDRKKGGSSKSGKGGRSRRNSGVEALGGVLGGFLMDQLGKKGRR